MIRTSNPALRNDHLFRGYGYVGSRDETMTISGTATKTLICLLLTLLTAGFTWMKFYQAGGNQQAVAAVQGWMMLGLFGGLGAAIATAFKVEWCMYTAPIYALLEGFFIGGISSIFESMYPGIVIQATGLTFGTLGTMLLLYQSGFVQVTDKFRMGVFAATGAIGIVYFASFILSFFGVYPSFIYSSSLMSIGFSLLVVVVASLNLVLDFDVIEKAAQKGVPKYLEWYGAFALMVTLVWLYVEFLRLLAKMRSR